MHIAGEMVIGKATVMGQAGQTHAIDAARQTPLAPAFGLAGKEELERACALAAQAFDSFRETAPDQRAAFLEAIADNILALGPQLIERAMQESGLPQARLEGERGRTMNQLRLFARVVRDGLWQGATLDPALPERVPPRPDLRLRKIGVGPVAVFGASNFPLAFSVAGGDTASALAAGCPVVVKAHPAHLGTSELVAKAVQKAVADCGLHEGVFSLLIGEVQTGGDLVAHPAIKAVGFTGSRGGGLALVRIAQQRKEPIPVYAEMASINPVFLLPGALAEGAARIAQGFVESLTQGSGQFCTNPGLLIGLEGPGLDAFQAAAADALRAKPATTMLTAGIHQAYAAGVDKLGALPGVQLLAQGGPGATACAAQPHLYATDVATFLATPALEDENFGPSSLLVRCRDGADLRRIAEHLEGQLTATVHATAADRELVLPLLPSLERKAGRILFNGFPTGVEVAYAMVHGGPFPATSDTRSTSVGASAIERFLRPVCYQDAPAWALPQALADGNPLQLPRVVDGVLSA